MDKLTHLDEDGNARMVNVGDKPLTNRVAIAEGWVQLSPAAYDLVINRQVAKGDVLVIAQLAGIQGAKHTATLIPLCHPLPLSGVEVHCQAVADNRLHVTASVHTHWRTGVEMEALTAVSSATLTIYDMLKAVDKGIEIQAIRLTHKSGGRSGSWNRHPE